jgi:hypothetical protein
MYHIHFFVCQVLAAKSGNGCTPSKFYGCAPSNSLLYFEFASSWPGKSSLNSDTPPQPGNNVLEQPKFHGL